MIPEINRSEPQKSKPWYRGLGSRLISSTSRFSAKSSSEVIVPAITCLDDLQSALTGPLHRNSGIRSSLDKFSPDSLNQFLSTCQDIPVNRVLHTLEFVGKLPSSSEGQALKADKHETKGNLGVFTAYLSDNDIFYKRAHVLVLIKSIYKRTNVVEKSKNIKKDGAKVTGLRGRKQVWQVFDLTEGKKIALTIVYDNQKNRDELTFPERIEAQKCESLVQPFFRIIGYKSRDNIKKLAAFGELYSCDLKHYTVRNVAEHLKVMLAMTRAIGYLHSKNIVHNDLKRANIMVRDNPDGSVSFLLGDHDLACRIGEASNACTAIFAAFEVVQNRLNQDATHIANPSTDVFAIGTLGFQILGIRFSNALAQAKNSEDWVTYYECIDRMRLTASTGCALENPMALPLFDYYLTLQDRNPQKRPSVPEIENQLLKFARDGVVAEPMSTSSAAAAASPSRLL